MIWWFRYWLRFHANSFCVHTARISNSLPTHYLLLSYNLNHFNINIKSIFLRYYLLHFPVPSFTVLYCKVDPFCRFAVFKIFALYHVIMNPYILQNFWKNSTPLLIICLLGSLLQELNFWIVCQVPFQKEMFVTVNMLRTFQSPNWVSKQMNSVKWSFSAIIINMYNSISYHGLSISNCAAGNCVVFVLSSSPRLLKHLTIVMRT